MMNLFKKRNQEPTDSDGILGKGILHLDAIISDLTEKQAKQEKEITRLQRLVTQHDQALTPNLANTVALYANGEIYSRNTAAVKQLLEENKPKEPHVRIEFDHINDVPTIFIDGEKVQDGLVSLNVDWKTNTENHVKKTFEVKVINKDGYGTTIGENSLI